MLAEEQEMVCDWGLLQDGAASQGKLWKIPHLPQLLTKLDKTFEKIFEGACSYICLGFLVNAVEAGVQCVTPGFPHLPPFSLGMGRQRSSMGSLPWGGKGGYPHTLREIWDLPELRWTSKSKTGTWQDSATAVLPPPPVPLPPVPPHTVAGHTDFVYP